MLTKKTRTIKNIIRIITILIIILIQIINYCYYTATKETWVIFQIHYRYTCFLDGGETIVANPFITVKTTTVGDNHSKPNNSDVLYILNDYSIKDTPSNPKNVKVYITIENICCCIIIYIIVMIITHIIIKIKEINST